MLLRARYPAAIAKVHDFTVEPKPQARDLSLRREHVFDFESGHRLIVALEKHGKDKRPLLHMLASITPAPEGATLRATYTREHRKSLHRARTRFAGGALNRWRKIADPQPNLVLIQFTREKGLPFWIEQETDA